MLFLDSWFNYTARMSRDISPFGVRMPTDLKERLEAAATKSMRSVNAEIVSRLSASFEKPQGQLSNYSDGDLIKELMDRYERGAVYIRVGKGSGD